MAGIALVACFFLGLVVWSAGRVGTVMMLVGVFGGLAYALGYQFISHFAGV